MRTLEIQDLGLVEYGRALALQQRLCAERIEDRIGNTVLLVEHPPVITAGARRSENKLRVSEEAIRSRGIDYFQVGRGGGATAHNPGQLVIYPIIKLKSIPIRLSDFVHALEGIGVRWLAGCGIEARTRRDAPGLWVGERKIGSIGVQARKWVTMHGMAVNLFNDLSIFDLFVPCGLDGVEMTSVLKETGRRPDMEAAKAEVAHLCRETFVMTESIGHE